jgi:hypothetical protein
MLRDDDDFLRGDEYESQEEGEEELYSDNESSYDSTGEGEEELYSDNESSYDSTGEGEEELYSDDESSYNFDDINPNSTEGNINSFVLKLFLKLFYV